MSTTQNNNDMIPKEYQTIYDLLSPIVETIKTGEIIDYSRDVNACIDYLMDELPRRRKERV